MIYEESFKIGLKDIGRENKITNRGILEVLENIASYHSDYVRFGANETITTGMGWILLEWKIQVLDRPQYGEKLVIKTWGRGENRAYTFRDFEVYDENNKLKVIATSKWALLDIENRKMLRLTDEIMDRYECEEKHVFSEEKLDKLKVPDSYQNSIVYEVKRRDIDTNRHMHNLYYLDLAYEILPEEVYNEEFLNNIRISYKKEMSLGDKVECRYQNQDNKHIIVIDSDNGKKIHSIVELF